MFVFEESRQLFQALHAFFSFGDPPSRPHEIQRLRLLFLRQFVDDVPHLVITAPLHGLLRAEHFFNGGSQCFRPVNDEQILAVSG
jgi:hypothetical protein